MNNIFNLNGRVAVITGGYGHLGSGMALALVDSGATVIVAGRTKEKYLKKFEGHHSDNLHFENLDLSSNDSVREGFKNINSKYKSLDILVNNGMFLKGRAQEGLSDEDFLRTMDGVIGSVHRCIREVTPYMKASNYGKIINISSMYGIVSPNFDLYEGDGCEKYTNPPHYGAGKAAVLQLTKYYGVVLAKYGINVNAISPGPFPKAEIQKDNPAFVERLKRKNPLNRIGKPSDLDGVIKLLSSEASNFICGQNISVDGGWTVW